MKKLFTTTLAIALSWTPVFAAGDFYDPESLRLLNKNADNNRKVMEAHARWTVAEINDPATLEKMAKDYKNSYMQRAAIAKIDDQKVLQDIAKTAVYGSVREAAANRLAEIQSPFVIQQGDKIILVNDTTDEAEQPNQKTTQEQFEKTSSNKNFLWLAVIALLAITSGMIVWKKKS